MAVSESVGRSGARAVIERGRGSDRPTRSRLNDLPPNLRRRIVAISGHWLWTGTITEDGYGRIELTKDGKRQAWLAHRLVWMTLGGVLPEDLHHDGCLFKHCVRPAHLAPLTKAEHTKEHHPPRSTCKWGHEYTPTNTYWRRDKNGRRSRQCRRCKADREIERKRTGSR